MSGHWTDELAGQLRTILNDKDGNNHPEYKRFTPWLALEACARWGSRKGKELNQYSTIFEQPGVYVVGYFLHDPPNETTEANPFDEAVVYVGRTRTGSLGARCLQFAEAAQGKNRSHYGGNLFWDHIIEPIQGANHVADVLKKVRIAAVPVWLGRDQERSAQPWTSFRTAFMEAALVHAIYWRRSETSSGVGLLNEHKLQNEKVSCGPNGSDPQCSR